MDEQQLVKKSIFDMESSDRVKSPEKIDEYIRIATSEVWLVVVALGIVLIGIIVWGIVGKIPVHYDTQGIAINFDFEQKTGDSFGYEDAAPVNGMLCLITSTSASAKSLDGKTTSVIFADGERANGKTHLLNNYPISNEETMALLNKYHVATDLVMSEFDDQAFKYVVFVELDKEFDRIYFGNIGDVMITTNEIYPIEFLLQGGN